MLRINCQCDPAWTAVRKLAVVFGYSYIVHVADGAHTYYVLPMASVTTELPTATSFRSYSPMIDVLRARISQLCLNPV